MFNETPPSHWTLTFFLPRSPFFIFYGLQGIKEINGKEMFFCVERKYCCLSCDDDATSTADNLKFVPHVVDVSLRGGDHLMTLNADALQNLTRLR